MEHSWTTFHAELEKVGKFHEQLASKAEELVLTLDNWVKEKEKTKIKVGLLTHHPSNAVALALRATADLAVWHVRVSS